MTHYSLSLHQVLLSDCPSGTLLRWANEGTLAQLLPDLAALRGVSQLPAHKDDAFIHTLKVIDAIEPIPVLRWAAMLHDIAKAPTYIQTPDGSSRFFEHDRFGADMVAEIMQSVGADPALIAPVTGLVRLHMRPMSYSPEWSDGAVKRLSDEAEQAIGPEGFSKLLSLARADLRGYLPEPIARGLWTIDSLEERLGNIIRAEQFAPSLREHIPHSPLDGNEIRALWDGEPGPWISELKDYLKAQVEAGLLDQHDKSQAAHLAAGWLAKSQVPSRPTTDH